MHYLLLALEGVLTFISPCLLPMLPLYLAYLTGQASEEDIGESTHKTSLVKQAVLFVLGFTVIFVAMGIFVTTIGQFVLVNRTLIHIISGSFMILLGVDYLLGSPLMNRLQLMPSSSVKSTNAFLFGMVFSITWTPCVGTFLAGALSFAATSTSYLESVALLLSFCLGLGIPFILSAMFIDEMKEVFTWVKKHFKAIRILSGSLLIVLGIATIFGWLESALIFLS